MGNRKVYLLQLVSVYHHILVLHVFMALVSLKLQGRSKNGREEKKYHQNMYMEIGHIAVIPQNTIINFICYIATVAQKGDRYEKKVFGKAAIFYRYDDDSVYRYKHI